MSNKDVIKWLSKVIGDCAKADWNDDFHGAEKMLALAKAIIIIGRNDNNG